MKAEKTFTIGQLAEKTGLTRRAIRLYEKCALLQPLRDANNYRCYTEQQVKEASVIRDLRACGIAIQTIAEIIHIKQTDWTIEEKLYGCQEVLDAIHADLLQKQQALEQTLKQVELYQQEILSILGKERS